MSGKATQVDAVRSAKLRARICELWRETAAFEAETSALGRLRADLEADGRVLTEEHDRVEAECTALEKELVTVAERCREVELEKVMHEQAATTHELQVRSTRRAQQRLEHEAHKLEAELQEVQGRLSAAGRAIDQAAGSMLRIDYKLRHAARDEGK